MTIKTLSILVWLGSGRSLDKDNVGVDNTSQNRYKGGA